MQNNWHETQSQAVEAAIAELKAAGAVLLPDIEQDMREGFANGGQRYNETKMANVPLASHKGKSTKKYGHVTIYRAESGRYEQTTYIL
jgi:hypothetical protein